jgi:hypothetical protein
MGDLAVSLRFKSEADIPANLRGWGRSVLPPSAKPTTYRNQPVIEDDQRFDSKLEARCYRELMLRVASREVLYFIRQPNFRLEGGVVYRADFLAVLGAGGVEIIDAKGFLTRPTANKIKQVKARYGIDVVLWKGERE